ncbi:hypothetical protein FCV25MIE_16460 [Fagus crenata]
MYWNVFQEDGIWLATKILTHRSLDSSDAAAHRRGPTTTPQLPSRRDESFRPRTKLSLHSSTKLSRHSSASIDLISPSTLASMATILSENSRTASLDGIVDGEASSKEASERRAAEKLQNGEQQ